MVQLESKYFYLRITKATNWIVSTASIGAIQTSAGGSSDTRQQSLGTYSRTDEIIDLAPTPMLWKGQYIYVL